MQMPVAATTVPTGFVVEFENGGHFLTRQDALNVNRGEVELVVYGKVEYQALQEKHVNPFCYVWYRDRGVDGDNGRFLRADRQIQLALIEGTRVPKAFLHRFHASTCAKFERSAK